VDLHRLILDALGWSEFPKDDNFVFDSEPEPCDNCELGLVYIFSFEQRRLCRNCVIEHADAMGWLEVPDLELKFMTVNPVVTDVEPELPEEDPPTSGQDTLF
jgi:hypothetical protein